MTHPSGGYYVLQVPFVRVSSSPSRERIATKTPTRRPGFQLAGAVTSVRGHKRHVNRPVHICRTRLNSKSNGVRCLRCVRLGEPSARQVAPRNILELASSLSGLRRLFFCFLMMPCVLHARTSLRHHGKQCPSGPSRRSGTSRGHPAWRRLPVSSFCVAPPTMRTLSFPSHGAA